MALEAVISKIEILPSSDATANRVDVKGSNLICLMLVSWSF